MRTWTARLGMLLGTALIVGLVAACGGGGSSEKSSSGAAATAETSGGASSGSAGGSTTVDVVLSEWAVKSSIATAKAGNVTFKTTNKGVTPHELLVVQSDLAADKLPQTNGVVEEKKVTVVGRTASLNAGKSEEKPIALKAGKYVLLCNLPAHYGQGMHTAFTVE